MGSNRDNEWGQTGEMAGYLCKTGSIHVNIVHNIELKRHVGQDVLGG